MRSPNSPSLALRSAALASRTTSPRPPSSLPAKILAGSPEKRSWSAADSGCKDCRAGGGASRERGAHLYFSIYAAARGLGSLGSGCASTIWNELLMVVHMEAPLRCSFWLERQTTLQSRKRLGIFREAANTSPERMN